MKLRKGNRPEGPGWLFKSILVGAIEWEVCYRVANAGVSWTEVKLAAKAPAPYKGNFYMKWNGTRFANSRDAEILASQHKELHDAAIKLLTSLDSEIFPKGAKERVTPQQAPSDMELLAKRNPELHAALMAELEAIRTEEVQQKVDWTNLGPVGVVVNLERDLLVREVEEGLEVRLSTSDPDTPTEARLIAKQVQEGLLIEGVLYNSLKRNTPEIWNKINELLRQYFLEKDFY